MFKKMTNYEAYLFSEHWDRMKRIMLKEAGNKCEKCKSTDNLQVHHLNYNHLWNETQEDLQVLCKKCHMLKPKHGLNHKSKDEYGWDW